LDIRTIVGVPILSTIIRIDTIEASGDTRDVVTASLAPELAKIKVKLAEAIQLPIERIEIVSIDEVMKGPLFKEYRIKYRKVR